MIQVWQWSNKEKTEKRTEDQPKDERCRTEDQHDDERWSIRKQCVYRKIQTCSILQKKRNLTKTPSDEHDGLNVEALDTEIDKYELKRIRVLKIYKVEVNGERVRANLKSGTNLDAAE